ncbi:MAG: ferrochelatase [Pseudomonadota bacterium]
MNTAAHWPAEHPAVPFGKVGVLLINLGTPDAPETSAVRRYLRQFLSDGRVIELNKILWWPILNGPILTFRSPKTAKNYAKVWGKDSPLRLGTKEIAEGLQPHFNDPSVELRWAMRYGSPSVESQLEELRDAGCERIVCFALYPQYSATTTASAYDAVFQYCLKARWQPALRTMTSYHDHPAYIDALKASIETAIEQAGWQPDTILASFHGLPQEYLEKGDPYHCQCQKTGRLLREALGYAPEQLQVTFQSRFGPKEWLKPYTDDVAKEAAETGKKRIMIISPAFVTDCLETLEELAMGTQEIFMEAGGQQFHYIPCLNDTPSAVALYADLIKKNMQGWFD